MTLTTMQAPLHDGIRSFTARQLTSRQWPARDFLIHPWLRKGESALAWAAPGVGKTMLSLTLALMVAGGGKFAGWEAYTPRKVLIVDGEMRGEDLAERLTFLAHTVEGINIDVALDNIEIRARQLQDPGSPFYDIADGRTQRELSTYIRKANVDFLILDNVTTLTDTMGDENSVEATKPVLAFLMDLKRTEVGVLLVHHSNKGGNTYRGSTSLMTTFEVAIGLKKPEGSAMGQACFSLEFTKFRAKAGDMMVPRVFTLDGSGWHVAEDEDDETTRLIRAIETCRFRTQQQAAVSVGIEETKASRLLKRAYATGATSQRHIRECLKQAGEAADEAIGSADLTL
ncbi:AAA family ATPase [Paracraurococcus ruber]|uniref:AAA+ ATPase domain-containing protein n=1 Tax=Paracraurococcus ruber TaxID=77675 RepID=A0ABS1CVH0_9PROT|nr:AAA family ATPase [Paracraurococcus ruber]MBK1658236.1 hypothetical protein [Paracraurococcus ruber]TDG30606.1 AAA family ATPase [Paracraurococcus ruber]